MSKETAKPLGLLYGWAARDGGAAAQALLQTRQWHKFVIAPDIPDLGVVIDYAGMLYKEGLFRLPYDEVVVQFGPVDIPKALYNSAAPISFHPDYPMLDRPTFNRFHIATIRQGEGAIWGRLFTVRPEDWKIIGSVGESLFSLKDWPEAEALDFLSLPTFTPDNSICDQKIQVREKSIFGKVAFILVGICNAEGIVLEHRGAKFINKRREAKGKPPLLEYSLLKIDPQLKTSGRASAGGTHASPRLHWRRGHIRRLPSGVLTQVRPCLVGSIHLGRIEKDYFLKPENTR